jgi:N-acetylmuramoyl-L-alanine amidase
VFGQDNQNFTIILDADMEGKIPVTQHGFTEKDIALKTTLKVGAFLEKLLILRLYTRTTDVF